MKNKKRTKNKSESRLPVDGNLWGRNDNTYSMPPEYYYDIEYECSDCSNLALWTASQQKHWYEIKGKSINSRAKRCRNCRAHINALKEEQKRHMDEMANEQKHPHEAFFKNT